MTKTPAFVCVLAISAIGAGGEAFAQTQPTQPTQPYTYPAYPTQPAPVAPAQPAPIVPVQPAPAPVGPVEPAPQPLFSASATVVSVDTTESTVQEVETDDWKNWRDRSLYYQNSRDASTGILWTHYAGSGADGTFRVSFLGNGYKGTGFLCNAETPCNSTGEEDDVDRFGTRFALSVTPLPFMEAYIGALFHATSDNLGQPKLLQVLGDTDIGVKFFMPHEQDRFYSFGGEAQLWLLNGAGSVGVDGSATSFALRALATADFSNMPSEDAVPLLINANLGYFFDNSGAIASPFENSQGGKRISRIQRFGLDINRVDSLQIGLGVEGLLDEAYIHPFAEFSIDIPVNRGYTCSRADNRSPGDKCLANDSEWSSTPSRVTLGLKGYPVLRGLTLLAAVDIGTGATSNFIEEVAPEMPWDVYFGVGYAYDVEPQIEKVEKRVEIAPPPIAYIKGILTDKETGAPIPDAILSFQGSDLPSMATGDAGSFQSIALKSGDYALAVSADGYQDGQCAFAIPPLPASSDQMPPPGAPAYGAYGAGAPPAGGIQGTGVGLAPGAPAAAATSGAAPIAGSSSHTDEAGQVHFEVIVQCQLEALPKVGTILGALIRAEDGSAVSGAVIKITDPLGRELELGADEGGAFRFENVPPGTVRLTVTADGYLTSVTEHDLAVREDLTARISLYERPETPNVVVTKKEVKLKKKVHFETDSAVILPDSMALLQEAADVLRNQQFRRVEIQGHTDDRGSDSYNLRLSQARADAVRQELIKLGVPAGSLVAKGYGEEKSLVRNSSATNRAKNRRVQLIIIEK